MKLYTIGSWVQREHRSLRHLVESFVADDVITKCGRRMRDEPTTDGRLVAGTFGLRKCSVCLGPDQPEA